VRRQVWTRDAKMSKGINAAEINILLPSAVQGKADPAAPPPGR